MKISSCDRRTLSGLPGINCDPRRISLRNDRTPFGYMKPIRFHLAIISEIRDIQLSITLHLKKHVVINLDVQSDQD